MVGIEPTWAESCNVGDAIVFNRGTRQEYVRRVTHVGGSESIDIHGEMYMEIEDPLSKMKAAGFTIPPDFEFEVVE